MHRDCALLAAAGLLLAACGGGPPTDVGTPEDDDAAGAVLSAPIPRSLVPRPHAAGASVVFVAVPPATVPRGERAVVRTSRGDSAFALVLDGGFDPVALPAAEGDGVEVRIVDSAGGSTKVEMVAARRRPRVVRTSPQPRSSDVPLNVRVTVVFSAPMDSATVAAGVRVTRGGAPVPGTLHRAPDGLSVEFAPAAGFAAQTDYEVTIDSDVRDVLGSPLGEPVQVPFRTGTATATIDLVQVLIEIPWFPTNGPAEVLQGESIEIRAMAGWRWSSDRIFYAEVPTQWSASPEGRVQLTELSPGVVRVEALPSAGGEVVVTATVAPGISGGMLVRTYRELPPDVADVRVWYAPDDGDGTGSPGVWAERLDGTGREQLFALSELPAGSAPSPWSSNDCLERQGFALSRTGRLAITAPSVSATELNGGTYIKDGPGITLRSVTSEAGSASFPAWSLDGERLAYWFDLPDQGVTELRVVEADGSGQRVLERVPYDFDSNTVLDFAPELGINCLAEPARGGVPLVWHPDGQRVLKWRPGGTDQVALDGSGTSPYMSGWLAGPWQPDGERQFVHRGFSWDQRAVGYFWYGIPFAVARRDGALESESGDVLRPLAISPDGRLHIVQGYGYQFAIVTSDHLARRRLSRMPRGFVP